MLEIDSVARNWWAVALRGVAAVLFGIVAMGWPDITLTFLIALFGAYAFIDGLFALAIGITSIGTDQRWWAILLVGLTGVVVGMLTFAWPGLTALALLNLIALWAIVTGILQISGAVQLRRTIDNEWLLALSGGLSVLFGSILLANPGSGALSLTWLIGVYAFFFGAMLIVLGVRLRANDHTTQSTGGTSTA